MLRKLYLSIYYTNKNYSTTFKLKPRLANFFKSVHPDQLSQAPVKIKQENLRSLKNFNSYIDAVNQQKPIQAKLLKFYISQKSNFKSRKFFSFTLELPQINSQQAVLTDNRAEKLFDDIINALNSKISESKSILGKKDKVELNIENEIKIETEQEKIKRMQETIEPFHKSSNYKKYLNEQRLKSSIQNKYMESQKQHLKLKLRRNMAFANTPTNKSMMWSRIAIKESGIYNDYQQILQKLIDPKLIYFDQQLTTGNIEIFKKHILPGQLNRIGIRQTDAVLRVCEQMEEHIPPLCFYVTNHYSATDIPGFFSIPYDFKALELKTQFDNLKSILSEQLQKYQQYYDYYQQISRQLMKKNNINMKNIQFKNNADISTKILMLQRLQRYYLKQKTDVIPFDNQHFKIFCNEYKLDHQTTVHLYQGKIYIKQYFQDDHLASILQKNLFSTNNV